MPEITCPTCDGRGHVFGIDERFPQDGNVALRCPTCRWKGTVDTRSAGGIDKADAARSEPSPVGDASTSVGRALTDDHGPSRECSNGPDFAIGGEP